MKTEPQRTNERRDNSDADKTVLKKVNKSHKQARSTRENASQDGAEQSVIISEANEAARGEKD